MSSQQVGVNGAAIRAIRMSMGFEQKALAEDAGISGAYLSQIERAVRTHVSPRVFGHLCQALGIKNRRAIMADPHATAEAQ